MAGDNDRVFLEFVQHGAFVKVTAIHSASGIEASITGPASAPREALTAAAIQKLNYVLNKQRGGT